MTLVDDFGRYDGRAALLHGECRSLRDDAKLQRTAADLRELDERGLIQLYEIDGKEYLQVLRWEERKRADKSKYPDPPQHSAGIRSIPQQKDASLASTSKPSPVHHRHSSDSAVGWSEQTGWKNVGQLQGLFEQAYPACNFTRQLAQAESWLRANPAKAKKSNWRKFLAAWFQRQQDRGGDISSNKNGRDPDYRKRKIADLKERKASFFREPNKALTEEQKADYKSICQQLREYEKA